MSPEKKIKRRCKTNGEQSQGIKRKKRPKQKAYHAAGAFPINSYVFDGVRQIRIRRFAEFSLFRACTENITSTPFLPTPLHPGHPFENGVLSTPVRGETPDVGRRRPESWPLSANDAGHVITVDSWIVNERATAKNCRDNYNDVVTQRMYNCRLELISRARRYLFTRIIESRAQRGSRNNSRVYNTRDDDAHGDRDEETAPNSNYELSSGVIRLVCALVKKKKGKKKENSKRIFARENNDQNTFPRRRALTTGGAG